MPKSTRTLLAIGIVAAVIVVIAIPVMLLRFRRRVIDRRIARKVSNWQRDTSPK
jgi:hypothetical protein